MIVKSHMLSKYDQRSLLSCKLHYKPRVQGKVPDFAFIPSVEEDRAKVFPPELI